MTNSLRIVFAGTPDFAARHLAALIGSPYQPVAVFTQPDRPAGRGKKCLPSPVKSLAQQHGLPVLQPASLRRAENQQLLADLHADLLIVVAYGLILPDAILAMPRFGCINVHGSLLPRWRGAAPIQRALWAGDTQTGVTIMQMSSGLDCGDILYQLPCPISAEDTSASLYHKLAQSGTDALLTTLPLLADQRLTPRPQDDAQACYAHKLTKEEARLDWTLSAAQLERCVRAFNPWPVSYFSVSPALSSSQPSPLPSLQPSSQPSLQPSPQPSLQPSPQPSLQQQETFKVWQASALAQDGYPAAAPGTLVRADKQGIAVATADGVLNLTTLQPAGKKPMSAADLLNSRRQWFTPGIRLA